MADIGTLTPEQMLQQQQILRQQKMAEMLMQKGMEQPQGQMISGHYVAPSIFQNLAGLANTYVGQRGIEKGEQAQLDLAKAIREQQKVGLADYYQTLKGTPEVQGGIYNPQGQITTETTRDMYGPNMELNAGYKKVAPVAAQAGNRELANMNASMDERLPAFLRQHAMTELTKPPKWEKDVRYDDKGREIHGWTNTSDPTLPFAAQTKKPEMTASERIHADIALNRARDEGIPVGGGGYSPAVNPVANPVPMNNAPIGTSPVIRQNAPAVSIAPNAPAYAQNAVSMQPTSNALNANQLPVPPQVNMAGVSPKEQRKIAGEQLTTLQNNVKNSYEAYPVIKEIQEILPNATAGYAEQGWKQANRIIGKSTSGSPIDAQLDILGTKLVMTQPRFEGQQSNLDVKLYERAAGDIANANLPVEDRLAALEKIKTLYKRYAPNLDWTFSVKPTPVPNANAPQQASKVPTGVDPAVWAVMTPAEKSLWK
jgi:hypothetical protein